MSRVVGSMVGVCLAFVLLLAPCAVVAADYYRGDGAVDAGGFWSGKPSSEQKAAALRAAKVNVWRSWLQKQDPSKVSNIRAREKVFMDALDDLVVNVRVDDEQFVEKEKRYVISIKAQVAEPVVSDLLGRGSGNVAAPSSGAVGEVNVVYLGISRRASAIERDGPEVSASVKGDLKTSSGSKRSSFAKDSAKSRGGDSDQSREEGALTTERATAEASFSSSSREVQRDERTTFRVGDASALNGALNGQFVAAKFNATPYVAAMGQCGLPKPDAFSEFYAASTSGELPSELQGVVLGNLRACAAQIDGRAYFVWASLTVDAYGKDPSTGYDLATVNLVLQVFDLKKKGFGPATIASQQKAIRGRASNKEDAVRNALDEAAKVAGDVVIQQLRAQNNL